MLECPIMYCNAFGFIPAFAMLVQNVLRKVCGVITFGRASSWYLLYFFASPLNIPSYCHTTHILEMGETRFRKDYCKWAEKKGYRNCERMAALIFATAQNGIPVLPNAPSTQIVITEAIRVLHTVEVSRDANW